VQATCPPLACRRGTVVTCSWTIYPTDARLQVRACLVVLGTGMGGRCGVAVLCAHGRAMPVTRLRVLRKMPHPVPAVCAVLMRGAAVRAPLRGRSGRELVGPGTSRMHAPLFVACGCPYSGSGIANSPCSALCWWRFQVQGRIGGACRQSRRGNWKFAPPSSLSRTRQQCTKQYALGPGNERPPCAFRARFDARPSKILATRRSYNLCAL
jgi:hypothetical protein